MGLIKLLVKRERARDRRELMRQFPAMKRDKLLEAFSVDPGDPLLGAVLNVLRGMEELAKDNTAIAEQGLEATKHYGGMMAAAREAQERILDLNVQALKRKRGEKLPQGDEDE